MYRTGQSLPFDKDSSIECDNDSNQATHRIVGEVDSFGFEEIHLCDKCFAEHQQAIIERNKRWDKEKQQDYDLAEARERCDECKAPAFETRQYRYPEEGMAARVRQLCSSCYKKNKEIDSKYDMYEDFDDDY